MAYGNRLPFSNSPLKNIIAAQVSTEEQPTFDIRTVLTPKAALFDLYHTEHDSRLLSEYHQHTDNTNLHSICKLYRIKLEILIEDLQMPLVCPVLNIVLIARSLILINQEFIANLQLYYNTSTHPNVLIVMLPSKSLTSENDKQRL